MADLKAAFRAAKEQRGGTKQTPAQIRALRAAKLQQSHPQAQGSKPTPSQTQQPAVQPAKPAALAGAAKVQAASNLPSDFFQSQTNESQPAPSAPVSRPAAASKQAARGSILGDPSQGLGPAAPVPEGFFADKAADAKARGVKLPDAKDKEDEFQAFQRSIEEDLKQAAAQEAEEAEEEAHDREEREDFVQWVRVQRIEELKKRKQPEPTDPQGLAPADDMSDAATVTAEMLGLATSMPDGLGGITLPKRQRMKDTLAMLEGVKTDDESSEGEEDGGGVLLDWRAKNV